MRLELRDLAFGYPGKPVGRGITLAVEPGQVLCLLGPNGCGKTTLFKSMLGLLRLQGGEIAIDGETIARWSRSRLAQAIAYVPQAHVAYFPFTVLDMVLMGRTARLGLFATPRASDVTAAEAALETLHVLHLGRQAYTQISGGQRQLVLIARALAQQPKILVMDEPTASLDFGNQILVLNHIKALARRGLGIILSTHDPDQAFACADRVAMLHDGRLLHWGPPQQVITGNSLHAIYGVAVEVIRLPGSDRHVCVPSLSGQPEPTSPA
jgi:iron complex transport system ATP-binding protein